MKSYYEYQMEQISKKLAMLKKQINNYKVIIEKNQGQIAELNAQIENTKQLRDNMIRNHFNQNTE